MMYCGWSGAFLWHGVTAWDLSPTGYDLDDRDGLISS